MFRPLFFASRVIITGQVRNDEGEMMQTGAVHREAERLIAEGRPGDAVNVIRSNAEAGDAEALYILGQCHLTGGLVPRDLAQSRDCFRRAAAAGMKEAHRIWLNFLANGTGGKRDWTGVIDGLRTIADDEWASKQSALLDQMELSSEGDPTNIPPARHLSEAPEVILFPALFTAQECAYLVAMAEPMFGPSVVVDPATGKLISNPIRTSEGAGFPLLFETPFLHALNRRIAAASGTTVDQGEPLQVLRYSPGQEYKAHFDALPNAGNQRALTMLVYLNDDYDGGETAFVRTGLKVKGRIGDGLLFRNAGPDGRPDPMSHHAGLPVLRGRKLIASRWIRARPLDLMSPNG